MNWSMSSDHCAWEGVSCDHKTGNVIGLDLSCSQLEGAILPNSTLFQLSHLQFLNLSQNNFSLTNKFPRDFGFFAKGLTHLNLSYTGLSGRVPSGISHLYKLVSLDLTDENSAKLEDDVFKSLLQNLTHLRVLNLQGVNISSVLPVNISSSLRVLNLGQTYGLHGVVPQEVFHLPNLEVLDLAYNDDLRATLPKVKWGSSATLQHLHLSSINIIGGLPDSIAFLESLGSLQLYMCNLSGLIPRSITHLGQLTYLGLSINNLHDPIPTSLANLTNLRLLALSNNKFIGSLPQWFFHHPSLEKLYLGLNGFTGQLYEFDPSKSQLRTFICENNQLSGPIPQSFSQLLNLTELDFSSNNFSGVLDFNYMFSRLRYLDSLDLSHNSLSVRNASLDTLPPKLRKLGLSSCKIKDFAHFSKDAKTSLFWVDLSNNDIDGEIPLWMGSVYYYLNVSHNRLIGGIEQLPWNNIIYLDLHSNMLNGSLPAFICDSSNLEILNLSNNNLSGVLPDCSKKLTSIRVFDLRMNKIQGNIPATLSNFRSLETINLNGNNLQGRIPSSFAEFEYLKLLDLGSNQINDTFPQCLEGLPKLQVLVLRSNRFHGIINTSSKVERPFLNLRIIDISSNEFSGPLPAIYFKSFKAMKNGEVNKMERSYMGDNTYYSDSTCLVIKGVKIKLVKILTIFTTIDVSRNNFEGEIAESIGNLVALRFLNLSHNHLTGVIPSSVGKLSMLESLDLSFNRLEGEIPQQIAGIYSLGMLNLSCNQLRGHIPKGSQFNTFENNSYVGNFGLCGHPLSKECKNDTMTQEEEVEEQEKDEDGDDDYFFSGFTWKAVVIGYGCGVLPAFIIGYSMLVARKPKWFAGIIARELGLKIRRMEIKMR
ncbi:receptor-like protein 7 [Daucus carota subsp. sativus]